VFEFVLPSTADAPPRPLEVDGSVVIIGANGSGKSRLGSWIDLESPHKEITHRVAAQRSLTMPETVSPGGVDLAQADLLFGHRDVAAGFSHKRGHRWGQKPSIHQLNDFSKLMVYLFSEEFEESTRYRTAAKAPEGRVKPTDTKLDVLQRIWERALPHRRLHIKGGAVRVSHVGHQGSHSGSGIGEEPETYSGAEMSDGERVVFYLIGQVLSAPRGAYLIIDEPEIHLHKSIQSRLWDQIEAARPDCLFIYLTHDLRFAASRSEAKKVWLRSFDGEKWDWDLVPDEIDLPEDLLLEILGSRHPILFTEGANESLDAKIYAHVYPSHTVVPLGGCEDVIHATTSFARISSFHENECLGLIDRDYRAPRAIESLAKKGVRTLDLAQIENVLLAEPVFRSLCRILQFSKQDQDAKTEELKRTVFDRLRAARARVVMNMIRQKINWAMQDIGKASTTTQDLTTDVANALSSIDVESMERTASRKIGSILAKKDYEGALSVFKDKGLPHEAAHILGQKSSAALVELVIRSISNPGGSALLTSIRRVCPSLKD
jgi:uncharacterized protein DUF4435/putative AbiEii toxin of type IV toxin-antitoxin system